MADIEARVNENSPIGFFTWCWTIVVEITDGRIGSKPADRSAGNHGKAGNLDDTI